MPSTLRYQAKALARDILDGIFHFTTTTTTLRLALSICYHDRHAHYYGRRATMRT